jgi:peptidoglycan/xylan/chitin deacetylase (PgdA/CDA1 family)
VAYGSATVTVTGKYSGLSASCTVKVCDVIQVAMTFDDGPSAHTAKLLDFLKEYDIKVTFFLVGEMIPYYGEAVKREVAEGHEIGYHSYDHTIQTTISTDRIIQDYEKTSKMLKDLTGAEFTLWRSPGGGYNQRVLDAIPVPHIYWSVDTKDWQTKNADKVCSAILKNATDGSIILLHDIYPSSVEAALTLIDRLQQEGYVFVTVQELLSLYHIPVQPGVMYRSATGQIISHGT